MEFFKSALIKNSEIFPNHKILEWLERKNEMVNVNIKEIPFSELQQWYFEPETGNLKHKSGRFFSIEGINIKTNWGNVLEWSQPIINQSEIGFLGIITKKINGILYFLMQAKIEPGNINAVQISPTLQATKSNYTLVHKGSTPLYLEYFIEKRNDVKVLLDQLQSEQGARFFKKRNRNIIIEVNSDIKVEENFCWLTLGQIKQLLTYDNVINMDTRTVISGISFGDKSIFKKNSYYHKNNDYTHGLLMSEFGTKNALNSIEDIISWITRLKSFAELEVEKVPLRDLEDWRKDETSIYHKERKYFSVIAVRAEIGNREVKKWTQPMIKSAQEGIIGFIIKKINGVYHFLVQAKLEPGNFDIIELASTVQCLTGNYRKGLNEYEPEFLDYVLNAEKEETKVCYSAYQSEEGGRFYKEQNKNIIIEVDDDFDIELPDKFIWMTLNQIKTFIKFNNYFNIQARSLLSAIRFI
jgi:dTDP-4-dehydro-6-deoxy-alpha-D-glucopyranose 2,3-dehydratase